MSVICVEVSYWFYLMLYISFPVIVCVPVLYAYFSVFMIVALA